MSLTAVQACLQEGDLINPVGPVFALLFSRAWKSASPSHPSERRQAAATTVWFVHGQACAGRTQTGWIEEGPHRHRDVSSHAHDRLVIDADGHLTYMGEDGCRRQIVGDPELLARLQELQGKDCTDGDGDWQL